ncbi:uncharacterized protein ANIA_11340 [Aspergillus nidulans FGSC A4]|uniref:Uncharacterized protein n=1 Tax=Emericella nidulans (strain FGSC A4 / ATCC 38163 / CBS 112.46 / NRRL 194 / M139) TaxID=227321 RepID=C8VP15_EMENI|nr:hypothetical protein [Aspergillus nidulans FGSC A4]CBF86874.1 TPA: conserved hypothetical protein [Aspergillus nidulans FGSC A4]
MESEVASGRGIDYNDVLIQMSTNLTNALNTYGPSSAQYQTVLEMLKDYMREIDRVGRPETQDLDPNVLSIAMGFLGIGK